MRHKKATPDPQKLPMDTLKKSITLKQATIYGIGIILGAGIYALIGEAAGMAGNAVWLAFVVSAIIASFTALSYAELSKLFPKSAAEFVYVQETTKSKALAFFIGYMTILTGFISAAAVALGFSTYFKIFGIGNPIFIAIAVIVILSIINFRGIEESAKLNTIFTIIEAGGLIFIIIIGLSFIGSVDLLSVPSGATPFSMDFFAPILGAAALIFFAYLGFEDIANIAEETKNPKKTVPLALLISLIVTTIIYVLVAVVAISVVPAAELAASSAGHSISEGPLALVASTALANPIGGLLFTFIALFATANTILILLIVSSRMLYGMARENTLPKALAKIHKKNKTPYIAIAVAGVISILFALSGSIGVVAALTNLGVFLVFFAVNGALIAYRYNNRKEKKKDDGFRVPGNIGWLPILPTLGAIFCFLMFATQYWAPIDLGFIQMPLIVFGMLVFLTAFPVFYFYRKNRSFFDKEF
ncbi:MAG: amino acid permease [Candidatus Diapherotrites archaeon]|jgi:basic amino acid/polyamine antiporter, APA family|uniref:Amino acid permease n=1 Tax=Candidatus Iainarchaeum sp. TaxID=3101447 RepID=A0A8T5GEY9_9ARCH|nr:amino acid permease [Candidatus Diapherotrites archaeon]MBT7241319.1 amino acid permease [Candidatus Diapherotrites archaeon]